jgi:hypothetical protein
MKNLKYRHPVFMLMVFILSCTGPASRWEPDTDWGHWRLGHRSDPEFLRENRFTVTFGSGAPNFENVSRQEFNQKMEEAKTFNRTYHDSGYIVLRYQIHMLDFYNERWDDFKDYIGPKPPEDPTRWITVRSDGTFPFYRYAPYGRKTDEGFETWGCPNNPYYVRMMEGRIRAQAETGIDGSYVDWTHIAGGTCYCHWCRDKFIQYLKENLPKEIAQAKYGTSNFDDVRPPEKRGEPFWMEWIQFRGYTVASFHKRLRTVARKYNPTFMISGNVFGGFGYGPIAYDAAGNMELLGDVDDFIYSEIQEYLDSAPRKNDQGTKITNSPVLKFLAAASHGKPVIVYATEITPPIFPDPTEKALSAMAQINIAEAAANHAVFREKRQTPPGATAIHRFLAENEGFLKGAHLASNVAIIASLRPYLADELSFAFSLSRVMEDYGIAHVMLMEQDCLIEPLQRYDLIVIPYQPLLSEEIQARLVRYVEKGGSLLLLGACGIKNSYNVANTNVPLLSLLNEDAYPKEAVTHKIKSGTVSYVPLGIPSNRFLIPMQGGGDVTTFGPSMADIFPDIPEGYTRNRMDKGLRSILELTVKRAESLLSSNVHLVDAPPYVEMTIMTNPSRNCMLFHLVNYNVTVDGTISSACNVPIQIVLPSNSEVREVTYSGSLSEMRQIPFKIVNREGGRLLIAEADRVNIYGLGIIQFK